MVDFKFTMNDIADVLEVDPMTVKRWVRWFEEQKEAGISLEHPIPPYTINSRGIRLWEPNFGVILAFKKFRESLPKGAFAEYNALHSWGKRGEKIMSRKVDS